MKRQTAILAGIMLLSGCREAREKAPEVQTPPVAEAPAAPLATSPERVAVASLRELKSDVSHRKARELIWQSAADQMPLANYDAIKTGASSSGTIRYNDQTEVAVGERSLVIVVDSATTADKESAVVALPVGQLDGRLKEGAKPVELVVRTARGWIRATRHGKFKASIAPSGDLQVKSEGGEVTVMAKGHEKALKQDEDLTISAPAGTPPVSPDDNVRSEAFAALPESAPESWSVPKAQAPAAVPNHFEVTEPKEKATVTSSAVTVQGRVTGKLKISLNGRSVVPGAEGKFSMQVPLELGINFLTFQIVGPSPSNIRYETREVLRK